MKGRILAMVSWVAMMLVAGIVLLIGTPNSMKSRGPWRGSRNVAPAPAKSPTPITRGQRQSSLATSYGKLPLSFEVNLGQTDRRVNFLSRGPGYTLFLTPTQAVLSLRAAAASGAPPRDEMPLRGFAPPQGGKTKFATVTTKLVGANSAPHVTGLEPLPGKVNYFIGNDPKKWRTNVPTYARVSYENIYPGVDLVYYGHQGRLENDFVVAAGANSRAIKLAFAGAKSLAVDAQGNLVLHAAYGDVCFHRPIAYQQTGATRKEVAASYIVSKQGRVRFQLAQYDGTMPLIIDPVLSYSTYLGGSGGDSANSIAVDSSGNTYVTGQTGSLDFPTQNPLQPSYGGAGDAFVAKLNPTGSALVYSTYLGGSDFDVANGIAVDSVGSAYVAGSTNSTNFPTTPGSFQTALKGGNGNAFVAKLSPDGSALVYSTYLGGSGSTLPNGFVVGDRANGIAVDSSGNTYVTGQTGSLDFPTQNPLQPSYGGAGDAFVAKLNPTGSALVYSTYLGGSDFDVANGIAVDSVGSAYVTGFTFSSDFPTKSAFQAANTGSQCATGLSGVCSDVFVTKLNPSGTGLVYSTYLGGSSDDHGNGIVVDGSGNAYVTGDTASANFPTKNGIPNTTFDTCNSCSIGFVSKLDATGSALVYSTYLGSERTGGTGIALDASGDAYVAGTSDFGIGGGTPFVSFGGGDNCGGGDFPAPCPFPFMAELNPSGSAVVSLAHLGGTSENFGAGIAVDGAGNAYVAGTTDSSDFPVTAGSLQLTNRGAQNGFVFKISPSDAAGIAFAPASLTFSTQPEGTSSGPGTITVINAGSAALNLTISASGDFSQTNNCATGLTGATNCVISVVFSPSATGTRAGAITVTDDAAGSPQSLILSGTGTPPAPIVGVAPASLNFGSQSVETTSAAQTVTVNNTGSATLNISSVAITGSNSSEFTLASGTTCINGSTVPTGSNCVVKVTFTPTTAGGASAVVTITDNAADSPEMVALAGAGTTPPPDFSFAAPPSAQTISAGQTATFSLSLSGSNGFSGNVSFTCSGAPMASTCSVSPNPAAISGGSPTTVVVSVATTARSFLLPDLPVPRKPSDFELRLTMPWLALLLLLALFTTAGRNQVRSRALTRLGLAGILLGLVLSFGCGGGSSAPPAQTGTPAGTSTIAVTAASGGVSHSVMLSLTVQ